MVELPGHTFWPDDIAASDETNEPFARAVGHRQVTDAHLLSLAIRQGGRLATFDGGVRDLVPARFDAGEVLELIP